MVENTKRSRRRFLTTLGTGAVASVLAGCSGDNESTSEDDGETTQNENEFVFTNNDSTENIDPAKAADEVAFNLIVNAYDGLVDVGTEDMRIVEDLATEWEAESEASTWTFTIRDDVSFHSGNDLTADDVVYSMERALALEEGFSSTWDIIENIEAINETTVEFNLSDSYGPLLSTFVLFFIVDGEFLKEEDDEWGEEYLVSQDAGTGAYQVESRVSGQETVMSKFEDYWKGWEDNQYDTARFNVVEETSTRQIELEQGDAHLVSNLSPQTAEQVKSYDNVDLVEVPSISVYYFSLNTRMEPFDDINVRRAIAHVFNKEESVNNIFQGGEVANGPIPTGMPGKNEDIEPYERNIDKAEQAIEESEYSIEEINQMGIEIVYQANWEEPRQNCLLLQENLSEIGITETEINAQPWATMAARFESPEETPQITSLFNTANIPSPDNYTYLMHHPSQAGSYIASHWHHPEELANLLEEARAETDEESRYELHREAQRMIVDGVPAVYVAYPPSRFGVNKNVNGFTHRGILGYSTECYNFSKGE